LRGFFWLKEVWGFSGLFKFKFFWFFNKIILFGRAEMSIQEIEFSGEGEMRMFIESCGGPDSEGIPLWFKEVAGKPAGESGLDPKDLLQDRAKGRGYDAWLSAKKQVDTKKGDLGFDDCQVGKENFFEKPTEQKNLPLKRRPQEGPVGVKIVTKKRVKKNSAGLKPDPAKLMQDIVELVSGIISQEAQNLNDESCKENLKLETELAALDGDIGKWQEAFKDSGRDFC
jgi:hypothetical protein